MRIESRRGPASLEEIAEVEHFVGAGLPASYRRFLQQWNGGSPSPSLYTRDDGFVVNLGLFLSTDGIRDTLQSFPGRPGRGLLPIALSGGGDYFFMDLVSGEVYLWDHQRHDLVFQAANLDYVASSLPDLLSGLAGEEVPGPDEIEVLGKSGDRDSARVFLRAHSVDEKNSNGRTLAMEAARYENLPVLKECVEHGASLSLLLHYAANNKSTRLLEYLLEVGADINERDQRGRTPLARAKMSDKTRRFIASRGGT